MTAARLILIGSSVLLAAAPIVVWQSARHRTGTRSAVADVARRQAAADGKIRQTEERLAAVERERAGLQAALDGMRSANASRVADAETTKAPPINPLAAIHDDPNLQTSWFASRRAALAADFGPFFRSRNLPPGQFEKFQDIMIRREEQYMDLSATMQARGLTPADPAIAPLEAQARVEFEAAATELLGVAGYQQWQECERTLPVRRMVSGLAGVAALAGAPLSAEQGEQMAQVMVKACWQYIRGGASDAQTMDWDAVDAQARTILSPAQLSLFQTVQPETRYNPYALRFGSQEAAATNQVKRAEAGLPPVSAPKSSGD